MKEELRVFKESVSETLKQLETAKKMMEKFKSDTEVHDANASELDQSRARVNFLEELVIKLKADISKQNSYKNELQDAMKLQVGQLRSDLEAVKMRYKEEQTGNAEHITQVFEMVGKIKSLSSHKDSELMKSKYVIEQLKANLMDKQTELQGICEENRGLKMKLHKASEAAEKEALIRQSYRTEEVSKSKRVEEQLEAELRRVKLQSDQWRKAAEVAAAMLSTGNNNGQLIGRTGSMDSSYYSPTTVRISSPYGDEVDEDLVKKKNANLLKKIGVLWKKQHK